MSSDVDAGRRLAAGIEALGLQLPEGTADRLMAYGDLVLHWNRVHNLTAARDAGNFVQRHLLDCLAALPWVPETGRLLDIGSGAGLPGLVFALARPRLECQLVEPRTKRAAFLNMARAELRITNAGVAAMRVEELPAGTYCDVATARAVTALEGLWHLARPRLRPGGALLALVAHPEPPVLAALEASGAHPEVHPLQVPGLREQRHLVTVRAIA